jgi:small GTP-binding protein
MSDLENNTTSKKEEDEAIKIVLVGNSGVGKTCISQRYMNDTFTQQEGSTVGASYFQKILDIDGKTVRLDIWDTAGQEKYRAMGKMFYKEAYIVLFIYDITDEESFLDLKNVWYGELNKAGEKHVVLAVVGNKSDMFLKEAVKEDEARRWANEIGAIYGLVSAKTGDCISLLFESVVRKYFSPDYIAKINNERKSKPQTVTLSKNNEKKERGNCC